MNLSQRETQLVLNALRVAMDIYAEDRLTFLNAAEHRLATQFAQQITDCAQLYQRLEQ